MIREAASIAVGIAGGVWLSSIVTALRHRLGERLYWYALRIRAEQQSRMASRRVPIDVER